MKQQYVIIAYDSKDENAQNRRMEARPAHLQTMKKLKDEGSYIHGGAILDNHGNMIGSVVVVAFKTRNDLDVWLSREPYVIQHVWNEIEIRPFRSATV
ncbi:hypothetical protein HMI54_014100 [Coelomomyces lativittatus]|nr:hypothetical protein HMI54_014100 [Coelomomyces lativittatus]